MHKSYRFSVSQRAQFQELKPTVDFFNRLVSFRTWKRRKNDKPICLQQSMVICMNDPNTTNKSLEKIQDAFIKEFEQFKINIPQENLQDRKSGSIPYGSGRIMFVFGAADGMEFMEYYGYHRMGDCRGRIYEDGKLMSLPELPSFFGYDPKIPGDKEKKEKDYQEEYEKINNELVKSGLLSAGPVPNSLLVNSYLRMKKD